jgi:hypothetical protein
MVLILAIASVAMAQSKQQAKLLRDAYKANSTEMLFEFFDNWAAEVSSNENEANNPYVAEAHKVFAAFYQPMQMEERGERLSMYDDKPYFIVQSSLWKICEADLTSFFQGNDYVYIPYFYDLPMVTVDSAIEFRPPVHFEGKKVVYLTEQYKKLLDRFLGNKHVTLGEDDIMQPAYSKGNSRSKHRFFNAAALIYYGHWGGYWQYETYPKANQIFFNPEMNRAVVLFRFVYEGGQVTLEKQNGEWAVVDSRFTWIE